VGCRKKGDKIPSVYEEIKKVPAEREKRKGEITSPEGIRAKLSSPERDHPFRKGGSLLCWW